MHGTQGESSSSTSGAGSGDEEEEGGDRDQQAPAPAAVRLTSADKGKLEENAGKIVLAVLAFASVMAASGLALSNGIHDLRTVDVKRSGYTDETTDETRDLDDIAHSKASWAVGLSAVPLLIGFIVLITAVVFGIMAICRVYNVSLGGASLSAIRAAGTRLCGAAEREQKVLESRKGKERDEEDEDPDGKV